MTKTPLEILQDIKTKTQIDRSEYSDLKSLLYNNLFNKIPIIVNKVAKGEKLFRTLPVSRDDITIGRKKYISYRPAEYTYPYFNRCSEPDQRHFYCSTDRHLSIGECSYFLSEVEKPIVVFDKDSELLEVGVWEVMEDLYVADLRFGTFAHNDTEPHIHELKEKYKEFSKDEFVNDFFDYINECFEVPIKKMEHLRYWLTACYSNYLFDDDFEPQQNWGNLKELETKSSMPIDGILYHSVKGIQTTPPLQGYNFALRTEVIDCGFLQLKKAGIFESKQISEKNFLLDKLIKLNTDISTNSWYYNDPTIKDLSS